MCSYAREVRETVCGALKERLQGRLCCVCTWRVFLTGLSRFRLRIIRSCPIPKATLCRTDLWEITCSTALGPGGGIHRRKTRQFSMLSDGPTVLSTRSHWRTELIELNRWVMPPLL